MTAHEDMTKRIQEQAQRIMATRAAHTFGPAPVPARIVPPRGNQTTGLFVAGKFQPDEVRTAPAILGPAGRPLEPVAPQRSCSGCDACCATLGVRGVPGHPEGVKPPHTRCENQSPSGCGVYADRPTPCRTYRCAWLEGQWVDAERPDRLGVIFDASVGAINAREVFRGGFNRARAKARLLELHQLGLHVKLVPYKLRRLPTAKPL